jgi:hypothetical protein
MRFMNSSKRIPLMGRKRDGRQCRCEAARTALVASPLPDICRSLYAEADALGEKDLDDIVAVIRAIEQRRQPSQWRQHEQIGV